MLFAGIDWSDRQLDYALRSGDGKVLARGRVASSAAGLSQMTAVFDAHAASDQIAVALEAVQAPWVQALLDRGHPVYPINPKNVERFRAAVSAVDKKSDPFDADTTARLLATFHDQLRPLRPDAPEIIALRTACQDRVRLVEEHTAKLNELQAVLKTVYPAFLGFFGDVDSQIALDFLHEFPTQDQMRSLRPRKLAGWLKRHGYGHTDRIAGMQADLTRPVLSVPAHQQAAKAPLIDYLAAALQALRAQIGAYERRITEQFEVLPEADWVRSLPGAGPTLGPALLAILGRDTQRFPHAGAARAFFGTAPVTRASGTARVVGFRMGCWKFARRTLTLFASASLSKCEWACDLYERQLAAGKRHYAALRAVAHKWVKILLALQRTSEPYCELKFLHQQRQYRVKGFMRQCVSLDSSKLALT